MKLLVERNLITAARLACLLLPLVAATATLASSSTARSLAPVANEHVELSDFVSILARRRYLDRPGPVEIVVAESKAELLDLYLLQRALIERHEAVRGQDTSLIGCGWRHEEVERLALLSVAASVLNQSTVDDTAAWRICQLATIIFHEKALVDALVHNDERELRHVLIFSVKLADSLLELRDLDTDDGITLSIAYTITEDHKVGGHIATVASAERLNGKLKSLLQTLVDDLLATALNQVLRVILSQFGISRSAKADD